MHSFTNYSSNSSINSTVGHFSLNAEEKINSSQNIRCFGDLSVQNGSLTSKPIFSTSMKDKGNCKNNPMTMNNVNFKITKDAKVTTFSDFSDNFKLQSNTINQPSISNGNGSIMNGIGLSLFPHKINSGDFQLPMKVNNAFDQSSNQINTNSFYSSNDNNTFNGVGVYDHRVPNGNGFNGIKSYGYTKEEKKEKKLKNNDYYPNVKFLLSKVYFNT